MGVSGQRHAPVGKIRYQIYTRLGRKQDPSGRVQKILPPPGFDTRTAQSVATELSCPTVCVCVCVCLYIYIYIILKLLFLQLTILTLPSHILENSQI